MRLTAGEIHLWSSYDQQIEDAGLLAQYYSLLNNEEREKYKRFHFDKDRHQYLITRTLVRTVLSKYVDAVLPSEWVFDKNTYGKPHIMKGQSPIPLRFNISHNEKLVVMAVILDGEIGVDVEYLPRDIQALSLAKRFFSRQEVAQLLALPQEKQKEHFFNLWTFKEAYIKACGMGLSIPLDHFCYSFGTTGDIDIAFSEKRDDQPHNWRFWQIAPGKLHKIAMAVKGRETGGEYTVTMREEVPLCETKEVRWPIAYGRLCVDDSIPC